MIIHRFAGALRNKDWFQVTIEVIVVVIGIFIGLQVDDWNTARQERAEGERYLERLYQELEFDRIHFNALKWEMINKKSQLSDLETAIISEDANQDFAIILEDGRSQKIDFFISLDNSVQFGWNYPSVRTTTFQDLQNSGRFRLIEGDDLPYDISYYYEESLIIKDRVSARITGYSSAVYEMVDGGEATVFNGLIIENNNLANIPSFETDMSIDEFLIRANNEEFLKLLRAEKNFTGFALLMMDRQLSLTNELISKIDEVRKGL